MAAASDMQGSSRTVDPSFRDGTNMVGIDFLPHTVVFVGINDMGSPPGCQRFRKNDGNSAMQHTRRLASALIHRHSAQQIIVAGLDNLDAKMAVGAGSPAAIQFINRKRCVPDRHEMVRQGMENSSIPIGRGNRFCQGTPGPGSREMILQEHAFRFGLQTLLKPA